MKTAAAVGQGVQIPAWAKIALVVVGVPAFLAILAVLPLPIPPYLDFQVLYHADMGLVRGISLYDHAGQVQMIAGLAHVTAEQVFVLPFPYPPWYALSTIWLAWIPIQAAVRIWFGINLLLLFVSVWLLTGEWVPAARIASLFVALLFLPVLGSMFVGQYDFPVLAGAALMLYALIREKPGLAAVGAVLLTFKPHLGAPILLVVLVHLWLRKDPWGRKAVDCILLAGAALFAVGFLASPLWPIDYFHSLTGFKDVSQCNQCVNVSMLLAGLLGKGFDQAVLIAAVLFAAFAGWLAWQWRHLQAMPEALMGTAVLLPLLANPYLQNYDYVLLLVPGFILAHAVRGLGRAWLALALLLPLIGLAFFSTRTGFTLVLAVVILLGMQVRATIWRLNDPRKSSGQSPESGAT
jgi:hypothetical protein